MRRGAILIFAVLIFAGLVSAQTANKLVLKDFRADGELAPGGSFTVSFRLRNIYDWELKDVNVQLEGGYPFLKASPVSVGTEAKILPNSDSKLFSYTLNVDDAALAGDYSFNIVASFSAFTYNTESQPFANTIPVTLKISAVPKVNAGLAGSTPAEVSEGQDFVLDVKVWNEGNGNAKNVWLETADTPELDVAFASQKIYVGDIGSKGSKKVQIPVKAEEDLPPGAYGLPVTITYESDYGNKYSQSTEFSVEVKKTADFDITDVKQGELMAGQKSQPVEMTLKNTGTKAAKDIRLTLLAKYPFTPTGKTYYLKELAPGDSKPASFHVDIDDQAAVQNYPADLQVEWREDGSEKSNIERFLLETSPKKEVSEDFWSKVFVARDPKLLAGLGGIILFFILLFWFKKVR